ncbi:MAG: TerC family protein [Bdellovibrionales bacterium]|nr:TerC family protein [Bdellovibrionales bacterium]
MDINLLATFALLVGLEIVLGIDNILLISILTDRLPAHQRHRARLLGLSLAFLARCVLLLGASYILQLSQPAFFNLSWKDLILIAGGGFLLFKAVKEIHHAVEGFDADEAKMKTYSTLSSVIVQMVLLDLVFSIDSVITAVGLTDNLTVIYSAVVASFLAVLAFASKIAAFVNGNPSLKVLALSFLVTIGVTLCVEGFGGHVPKSYIYLPMGFALGVEALQMRLSHNMNKKKKT